MSDERKMRALFDALADSVDALTDDEVATRSESLLQGAERGGRESAQ